MHKIIIALILILALAACGASTGKPTNKDYTPQDTLQKTENSENHEQVEPNDQASTPKTNSTPVVKDEKSTSKNPSHTEKPAAPETKPEKEGYKVTFLEIGAESCIPCRMMQPIMKEIADEYPGVVEVIFHDLYKNRSIAQKYNIRVMPTQVFLDAEGREFFRHEGFYAKDQLKAMLDKYLASIE